MVKCALKSDDVVASASFWPEDSVGSENAKIGGIASLSKERLNFLALRQVTLSRRPVDPPAQLTVQSTKPTGHQKGQITFYDPLL